MAKNQSSHYLFTNFVGNLNKYTDERNARMKSIGKIKGIKDIDNIDDKGDKDESNDVVKGGCYVRSCIAPRTRTNDYAKALSFEVFDPLWMLARQWQYGRFKGNDCGSMVTAKIRVNRRRLDSIYPPNSADKATYSTDTPMEYDVEKMNRPITPMVRIESAIYFRKTLLAKTEISGKQEQILAQLIQTFPLDPFIPDTAVEEKTIETLKIETNANLKQLYAAYGKRIFDGYKLYQASLGSIPLSSEYADTVNEYKKWFANKYFPVENETDRCWNERKLGYEMGIGENSNRYEAEDYHTGRLSWYSFDAKGEFADPPKKTDTVEQKLLSYMPVPANFPGAPKRRLWEFEDTSVQFGHQANDDFSLLANAVIMQYITMYGNDWMLTPIEAETGTVLNVEGIIITDTFGDKTFINQSAEKSDALAKDVSFIDRWNLFGTTLVDAYSYEKDDNFAPQGGLLFPPSVKRTEESSPIEEVQFLRDEMANMLWGVETVINDGCGGTIDGKKTSDDILAIVDEQKKDMEEHEEEYDYSFLLQNRVPINWIPFIPQKIDGEIREIIFRRAAMPVFYNGDFQKVRPATELLKIKEAIRDGKKVVLPRYINEEEITGYGIKLELTAQRTRWFLGESFNWIGAKKVISQYQANSGLLFDELIEKNSNQVIKLEQKKC